jgi:hypothetical protein
VKIYPSFVERLEASEENWRMTANLQFKRSKGNEVKLFYKKCLVINNKET